MAAAARCDPAHIKGHLLTNTLLITLWTFNTFTPYLLTAGGPNGQTDILSVYIYQTAIPGGQLASVQRSRSSCSSSTS